MDLVRAINTAEMQIKRSRGSFAEWSQLVASDELAIAMTRFSQGDPKLAATKLSPGTEARVAPDLLTRAATYACNVAQRVRSDNPGGSGHPWPVRR